MCYRPLAGFRIGGRSCANTCKGTGFLSLPHRSLTRSCCASPDPETSALSTCNNCVFRARHQSSRGVYEDSRSPRRRGGSSLQPAAPRRAVQTRRHGFFEICSQLHLSAKNAAKRRAVADPAGRAQAPPEQGGHEQILRQRRRNRQKATQEQVTVCPATTRRRTR